MEKHTNQMNDHSGHKFYEYKGKCIELLPTFIYEVILNKYWKNGFCQLDSKFYRADKLLHIKNNCIINKYDGYSIEKEISLIGAPQEFIDEMKLSLYISKINKKSKKNEQRNRT